MALRDVYRSSGRLGPGYVVDIQSDLLADPVTRVVIPLLPEDAVRGGATRLNPIFEIGDQRYALMTHLAGTVPRRGLACSAMTLKDHRDAVIDVLITGF